MPRIRNKEIKQRRQLRHRIRKLKKRLAEAKTEAERGYLIERIRKREPFFNPPKD